MFYYDSKTYTYAFALIGRRVNKSSYRHHRTKPFAMYAVHISKYIRDNSEIFYFAMAPCDIWRIANRFLSPNALLTRVCFITFHLIVS